MTEDKSKYQTKARYIDVCLDAAEDWLAHQEFLERSRLVFAGERPREECSSGLVGWMQWRNQFAQRAEEDLRIVDDELKRLFAERKLAEDEYTRLRRLYRLDAQITSQVPEVGGRTIVQQSAALLKARFCPKCAADLSSRYDALHCPSCGADLQARPIATPRDAVPITAGYCQSCGASLKPNSSFCGSCGSPAMPPKPSIAVETPMPTYCVECGAQLKPGSSFCGKCGTRIPRQG